MPRVYFPPRVPIPEGATEEDRRRMFNEYKAELVRLNPGHFNADGTQKTLWQAIKYLFR